MHFGTFNSQTSHDVINNVIHSDRPCALIFQSYYVRARADVINNVIRSLHQTYLAERDPRPGK